MKKMTVLNIIGTYKLMNWIRSYFNNLIPIVKSKIKFENKGCVCSYSIVGIRALKILTEFKKIDILRLDRKWNKIDEYEKMVTQ
jgi:hypothetical protein